MKLQSRDRDGTSVTTMAMGVRVTDCAREGTGAWWDKGWCLCQYWCPVPAACPCSVVPEAQGTAPTWDMVLRRYQNAHAPCLGCYCGCLMAGMLSARYWDTQCLVPGCLMPGVGAQYWDVWCLVGIFDLGLPLPGACAQYWDVQCLVEVPGVQRPSASVQCLPAQGCPVLSGGASSRMPGAYGA